jgi:cobalamin biosynthesis protein CobT
MTKAHMIVHEIQQTAAVFGRNQDVTVVFEGDGDKNTTAYTDGKEITLPSLPDNMEFSHEETMVMRGLLDHEAGHVRHTNFEDVQAFGETQSQQAFQLGNCLEDMRLEKLVMEEYPGSQKNFKAMRENVGKHELEYFEAKPEVFTTINGTAIQAAILRAGSLDYAGEANQKMFDMMPERFQEWGKKFSDEAKACKDTKEILNLALAIEKLLAETPPNSKPESMDGDPDKGKGLNGDPADFKFDKDGDITEGKPRKPGKQGNGKPIDAAGNEMLEDLIKKVKDKIKSKTDQFLKEAKPKGGEYRVLTTRYDEIYSRKSTNERPDDRHDILRTATAKDYEVAKAKLGGLVNTMKARLRRALMAKDTRDWDYGRELGKLDTKRLVVGSLGSQTIYKQRKDRLEMDTAVHFLIDLSGSMSGSKIVVARDATIAFSECLEGTGISYQVSGFDNEFNYGPTEEIAHKSSGKFQRVEPLNILLFKEFNEPLQQAKGTVNAIAKCRGGNNSDRDAVIWAYHELLKRPEKRKILFVLSDGQPANETWPEYQDRGILVNGLKMAIDECGKNGVECVGVGILTDHVKNIYPKSVSINKVDDLSGAIFTQLSNLLTGGKVHF